MPLGPESNGLVAALFSLLRGAEVRRVSDRDLMVVDAMHDNGWLRSEVEARLALLPAGDPRAAEFARLARDCVDLFAAVDSGRFHPSPEWRRLEGPLYKALAYFLRGADAIPDDQPGGLNDDFREFREFSEGAAGLLLEFEVWRARNPG